jgi:hypothetical protein
MAYPSKISLQSMYGLAFQYADKTLNNGTYTGSLGLQSDPNSIDEYVKAVKEGASRLAFTLYVPKGYGKMGNESIPNIAETEDPGKVYTSHFNGGKEIW